SSPGRTEWSWSDKSTPHAPIEAARPCAGTTARSNAADQNIALLLMKMSPLLSVRDIDRVEARAPRDAVARNLDLLVDPSARHRGQDGPVVINCAALALDLALEGRARRAVRAQHLDLDPARLPAVAGDPGLRPQILARVIGKQAEPLVMGAGTLPPFGDAAAV